MNEENITLSELQDALFLNAYTATAAVYKTYFGTRTITKDACDDMLFAMEAFLGVMETHFGTWVTQKDDR